MSDMIVSPQNWMLLRIAMTILMAVVFAAMAGLFSLLRMARR
jgi:hypothetical protein